MSCTCVEPLYALCDILIRGGSTRCRPAVIGSFQINYPGQYFVDKTASLTIGLETPLHNAVHSHDLLPVSVLHFSSLSAFLPSTVADNHIYATAVERRIRFTKHLSNQLPRSSPCAANDIPNIGSKITPSMSSTLHEVLAVYPSMYPSTIPGGPLISSAIAQPMAGIRCRIALCAIRFSFG